MTAFQTVLVRGQQTQRAEFLKLLGESLGALLDYHGPQFTGALSVHVRVHDGLPYATVGRAEEGTR